MRHSSQFRTQTGIKLSISVGGTRSSDKLIAMHGMVFCRLGGDEACHAAPVGWGATR